MAQRLLTLRVRPARMVVLISSTSPTSDFVLVVRFLSQIWGGRFNPILAVDPDEPDPLTDFRLATIRPDFVFGLNLQDDVWQSAVHNSCQPRRYIHLSQEIAEDIRKEHHLGLIHSDRAIVAMFEASAKRTANTRPLKAVDVESSSELSPYFAAMFGMHPEKLNERYRDEQTILESPSAIEFIDLHKDFVERWKMSWLDAGSYSLDINHAIFPPIEPTIVVVMDVVRDLCHFWNLRLNSDTSSPAWIIPVPASEINNQQILMALRNWLLAFAKYGMKPDFCVVTSASGAIVKCCG